MIEFEWDESYETQEEIIKQELLNDAHNHELDIDPMNGITTINTSYGYDIHSDMMIESVSSTDDDFLDMMH